MHRFILAAALILLSAAQVLAQSVQQSGTVTAGHATRWVSNGIIGDSGTANDSPVTTFGVTSNTTAGICVSSGRSTAAGRQQLCLGAPLGAAGIISLQNYGTATAQDLNLVINGTTITIPTGGSGTIPTVTLPLVNLQRICASGTTGLLAGCTGTANTINYWTSTTTVGAISAAASSVLVTSSGSVPSLSQTLPSAVQGNITTVGTITSGTWSGTPITVVGGGTSAATLTAHGVLLGQGTSAITSTVSASIGLCLLSQGTGTDPVWASCASGSGTAGGSTTQVQFNNATNLAGSANLTWVTPALTIGVNATATGQLVLANGGALGVSATIQNPSATSAYNFNLPTGAGTTGQPLLSGGGGSTAMSFGTLGVSGGGTNCSAAAGACLDNITGFSSTGYITRTGSGTYAFSTLIPLSSGGTNAALTASNGGIFYSTASAGAILSGTATANQMLLSGSSTTPAWSTATHPATTTINQILYSSSANVIAGLATANSGVLITSAGGVPSISSTIPSATQDNITRTGTITSGVWTGTSIALANGGTSAALTASTGGIVYSSASTMAILSGTATASFPLLSGSTAAPTWATITYPGSATSGGILYFSSSTAMASSGVMGANQLILGGGAGTTPTSLSCGTSTTVLHGGTPPTCSQIVAADITTNTITLGKIAQIATVTLLGNATSGTTDVTAFTINGLTARGAPDATNDQLLIWDSAAGTLKKVTPALIASSATSGVSSIAGNTGAFTLSSGITNATNAITLDLTYAAAWTAAQSIQSASATAFTVGRLGATTPALQVDASTGTSITGVKIKSAATGGGVAVSAVGETNVALTIDANGSGTITVGGTSTGAITLTRATTLSAALTYGGVALSNAVTGTGNMVLSAAPTITGTALMSAGLKATGNITSDTASAAAFDFAAGGGRIISWGADTSTNGIFTLTSKRSNGTNSLDFMTFAAAGTVVLPYLANAAQSNAACFNSGTGALTYNGGVTTCLASTLTVKTLNRPITPPEGLNIVLAAQPYEYKNKVNPKGDEVGLICEYMAKIDERLTARNDKGECSGVRYEQYAGGILTAAIQELAARIIALEKKPK